MRRNRDARVRLNPAGHAAASWAHGAGVAYELLKEPRADAAASATAVE
ncbi:MAG TPA: hypothetical protein VFR67_10975 [Pilimelia sp.]|nr:hypothetical protein [Pilimelia sp.]